jgi:hypothetical protein
VCSASLDFFPKCVELGWGCLGEGEAAVPGDAFDGFEAALEFGVGFVEGEGRVDVDLAAEVDDGEEEVAELFLGFCVALVEDGGAARRGLWGGRCEGVADFVELFGDLVGGAVPGGPVEADAGGAVLEAMRAVQGGEIVGETVGEGLALFGFHALPGLFDAVAIEVWVPAAHFGDERLGDVGEVEGAAFFGDHGVEEDLEEDVAELFAHERIIRVADCVVEFVGFLDEIRAQRFMRLGGVPIAPFAQIVHQLECFVQRGFGRHYLCWL